MDVVFLIFDGLTALDAVGPYEVLSRLPGARVRFVSPVAGIVTTADGFLGLRASQVLGEVRAADVLVIPGGRGTRALLNDGAVLDWIRGIHESTTWTTSVCTGSLLLGAAGILKGVRATTHWLAMEQLAGYGALPVRERVVIEGKIATAAGVSAGIDFALELAARVAGPDVAQEIQLMLEYAPRPPFDSGTPESAPSEVIDRLRRGLHRR